MLRNLQAMSGKYVFHGDDEQECVDFVEKLNKMENSVVTFEIENCIPTLENTVWVCVIIPHKKSVDC